MGYLLCILANATANFCFLQKMGELEATRPGAHRALKYTLPATLGLVGAWKATRNANKLEAFRRNASKFFSSSKKMPNGPYTPKHTPKRRHSSAGDAANSKATGFTKGRYKKNKRAVTSSGTQTDFAPMEGVQVAKLMAHKGTQASFKKRRAPRRGGAPSNRFVSARKRNRKTKRDMLMSKGVHIVDERGCPFVGPDSVYVGHTTQPVDIMLDAVAKCIAKRLLNRAGVYFESWDFNIASHIGQSDGLIAILWYRNHQDPDAVTKQWNLEFGAAGGQWDTPRKLGATIYGFFRSTWEAKSNSMQLEKIELYPTTAFRIPYTVLILRGAKIKYHTTSALKVQNTSLASAFEDTIDEVDAVSLYGKIYQGKGNGMEIVGDTNGVRPFIADRNYGIITKEGRPYSSQMAELREPVPKELTKHVKYCSGTSLESGELVSNVIRDKKTIYLNSYLRILMNFYYLKTTEEAVVPTLLQYPYTSLGKFMIVGLEKKLEIYQTDNSVTTDVSVMMERNITIDMALIDGRLQNKQVQIFNQGRYVTNQAL